jgi:hypothetical protein
LIATNFRNIVKFPKEKYCEVLKCISVCTKLKTIEMKLVISLKYFKCSAQTFSYQYRLSFCASLFMEIHFNIKVTVYIFIDILNVM